jgi:hypothetical protein
MMKINVTILTFVLLFSLSCLFAQFAGGNGTADNPWQISNPDHLYAVRDFLGDTNQDKHFILINDINLDVPPHNADEGWLPIGNAANPFSGHFNGNGFAVEDLFIERPGNWYVSLFGVIGTPGVVDDLHLTGVAITGYSLAAGIAGLNRGTIINCSVSGTITGSTGVGAITGENNTGLIEGCSSQGVINTLGNNGGGLVGRNRLDSTITDSYSTADVVGTGNNSYGGLVGWNDSIIISSSAHGNVNGIVYCGGLVGRNYRGSITNSFATGNVVSLSYSIGGLAGGNGGLESALITGCYATGNVIGDASVGGLVGENRNHGVISNSYALGEAWASNFATHQFGVGGLLGELHIGGTVEYCYSAGDVSGNAPIGGLIGYNRGGEINVSYWNTETSNQATSAGGMGLTTLQMTQEDSFYNWDFDDIWQIIEAETYPYLQENTQDPPPTPYGEPEISFSPSSYNVVLPFGDIGIESLFIENTGDGPLTFSLIFDDFLDQGRNTALYSREDWVTFDPDSGVIQPGEDMEIDVIFDTTELFPGEIYYAAIIIYSNAADPIELPVTLEVLMPDFPPPVNLNIDNMTGLLTWGAPIDYCYLPAGKSLPRSIELTGYDVYLDGVLVFTTEETEYQFQELVVNEQYTAGVRAVYDYGASEIVTIEFIFEGVSADIVEPAPADQLYGNYPNPFNPKTNITFSLKNEVYVTIEIFDIRGAKIHTLIADFLPAGFHNHSWDGETAFGESVPSGVYFYRMKTDEYEAIRKMILLK